MEEKAEIKRTAFDVLSAVDVSEHVEVKNTGKAQLSYLSWAWAWAYVKKLYPDAAYEIIKFDGLPYVYDAVTGYMVYTTVTIEGVTHEMWLPVMDGQNRAMLSHPYEVSTKYNTIQVQAATMFDINKTIMRCLTKNLAMFGLGLSLYAGEDIASIGEPVEQEKPKKAKKADPAPKKAEPAPKSAISKEDKEARSRFVAVCQMNGLDIAKCSIRFGLNNDSAALDFDRACDVLEAELAGMQEV